MLSHLQLVSSETSEETIEICICKGYERLILMKQL